MEVSWLEGEGVGKSVLHVFHSLIKIAIRVPKF